MSGQAVALAEMYEEYRRTLAALVRRRDEVALALGEMSKRYGALEEEIDEMEEDMMRLRGYLGAGVAHPCPQAEGAAFLR